MEEKTIKELKEDYKKYPKSKLIERLIIMDKILTNLSKIAERRDLIGFMFIMNKFNEAQKK